jgi:hypothetical protein
MKKVAITFAIIITACITVKAETTSFAAPMDTIKEKVIMGAFFEGADEIAKALGEYEEKEEASRVSYARKAIVLPLDYTGYKIELTRVYHKPLADGDELLMTFGGISLEVVGENAFAYLIGDFETKEGMMEFLEKVIQPNYPNAKAVVYKNGIRVEK